MSTSISSKSKRKTSQNTSCHWLLTITHKVTLPLAFVFGIYGILAGIAMDKETLWLAGIMLLFMGWLLRSFIKSLFE